jgi:glycosyltransferase involved in cell wall biosynthesis
MKTGDRKLNILFLLQTLRRGGSENIVKDLCSHLNRDKFNFSVIALTDGELKATFEEMGVPALCVHREQRSFFAVAQEISFFIKNHGIDVVNAHHFTPFIHGLFGAKVHGCKIYYTAHSRHEVDLMGRLWAIAGSFLLRFADGSIGISPDVSRAIKQTFHLPEKKILTVMNAVNHRRFNGDVDRRTKRRELGLDELVPAIGCVGNLRQQKNYPNLIRAFAIIRRELGKAKLIIVGEGKREEEIKALIADLGLEEDVMLLGPRSDVPEILKTLDVYCLASSYEGLPLSLLEAMLVGLPAVGTEINGTRDVITHGQNGLLAPPNNPEELAKALLSILKNKTLAKVLAQNGREYVLEHHGYDKWTETYERLFSGHYSACTSSY